MRKRGAETLQLNLNALFPLLINDTFTNKAPNDWLIRQTAGHTNDVGLSFDNCREKCSKTSDCSAFTMGSNTCTIFTTPMNSSILEVNTDYYTYIKK